MKVYLAGGMRSGWQDKVKSAIPALTYYSPTDKAERDMSLAEYGTWDLFHIQQSDLVFVYMEKTNPSGFGLAVEMGYAYALGKTVILVLEPHDTIPDRYLAFLTKAAHVTFDNFESGVQYLASFVTAPPTPPTRQP